MEHADFAPLEGNIIEKPVRSKGNKKRKWREIEALKERQRLMKELQELDFCTITDEALLDMED